MNKQKLANEAINNLMNLNIKDYLIHYYPLDNPSNYHNASCSKSMIVNYFVDQVFTDTYNNQYKITKIEPRYYE